MLPRKQILQAEMIFYIYQKVKNFLFLSEKLFSYTFAKTFMSLLTQIFTRRHRGFGYQELLKIFEYFYEYLYLGHFNFFPLSEIKSNLFKYATLTEKW